MNIIRKLQVSVQIAHIIRFVLIVVIVSPIAVYAAHIGLRPITNGKVNQGYLYGEAPGHKGIDFPVVMGTEVKAIASGRVVALRSDVNNNSGVNFGNYVLIRHEQRHWVRQNNGQAVGQWGYVYSLYAHLKQNSVIPALQAWVSVGTKIAEVDNTGNSTGNHLHLQLIIHESDAPQMSGADLNLGWTEPSSRNPELWMAAFNDGATQTGTAVGVVTDTNGNPVAGLKITGVQKPGSATHGTYGYSETYDAANENPDDLLVENFATTDVSPGTYHLYAYKISDGSLYRYLGWHTFEAGRTTYVGLSPNYLPNVDNLGAQTSTITLRNNNGSRTARVNTTFLWYSGTVYSQQQNSIAPNATLTISAPTNFLGSALVVGSEDVSVVVETSNTNGRFAYSGIASTDAATKSYLPAVYKAGTTQWSDLYVLNAGSQASNLEVSYRKRDNTWSTTQTYNNVAPGARLHLSPPSQLDPDGSAIIESKNGQPLAVVAVTSWNTGRYAAYTGIKQPHTTLFAPSVYRVYSGSNWSLYTATVLQNTTSASASVRLRYINRANGNTDLDITRTHDAYTARGYNTRTGGSEPAATFNVLGSTWDGSVQVDASQPLAAVGTTIWGVKDAAGHYRLVASVDGRASVVLPRQYRNGSGANCDSYTNYSAINVLNVGASPTTVQIQYYDDSGIAKLSTPLTATLQPGQAVGANTCTGGDFNSSQFTPLGSTFTGSAVVTTSGGSITAIANLIYPTSAAVYDGVGR